MRTRVDRTTFALATKGYTSDVFTEGKVHHHHFGRAGSGSENPNCFNAIGDPQSLQLHAEDPCPKGHPDAVASPWAVLCTVVESSVEDLSGGGIPLSGRMTASSTTVFTHGTLFESRRRSLVIQDRASRSTHGSSMWIEAQSQHGQVVFGFARTDLVAG